MVEGMYIVDDEGNEVIHFDRHISLHRIQGSLNHV